MREKLERNHAEAQIGTTKVFAKQEIASQKIPNTMYGCKVESLDSTRQRVESSLLAKHGDRVAGKGFTWITYHNSVHKENPVLLRKEDSGCKNCSNPGMAADESQKQKKEVIADARNESKTVHFASLMDLRHLKNSELEPQFQKIRRSSCTPR